MKTSFFIVALALTSFFCQTATAQIITDDHHDDAPQQSMNRRATPSIIAATKFEVINVPSLAPAKVSISLQPLENDSLLVLTTPGFTNQDINRAQLSVLALIYNTSAALKTVETVTLEYQKNNQTVSQTVSNDVDIESGYIRVWQNGRPYHKKGDVVYLDAPFPNSVTLKFYFKGFTDPLIVTKKIKPFVQGFSAFPFAAKDLKPDEYVSTYAMHGGGDQVFAYDVAIKGLDPLKLTWNDKFPLKDGSQNVDYRSFGKPIYAMADGVVLQSLNMVPNNPKPDSAKATEVYWKPFQDQYGGGGNHFYIKHGNLVALYAHMQKGTLNSNLLAAGSIVKKGDFLGYSGNSGNSTGPHMHIHVKTYDTDATPEGGFYRPLQFTTGYVIGQSNYPSPQSNINWSKLNMEGISGLEGKWSFLWPSDVHPYCAYPTNWGEVSKVNIPEANYQLEFEKMTTCGYYPISVDGFDVNGQTFFNVICRPANGLKWFARHGMTSPQYQQEVTDRQAAGYRLSYVDSYLSAGSIHYAAIWLKDNNNVATMAYNAKPLALHESEFQANVNAGWVPVNISCTSILGLTFVTAIWQKTNVGGFYAKSAMTLAQFQTAFDDFSKVKGFKLVYVDGYTVNGTPMISGIWYKNAPNYASWWAKPSLNINQFQTEYTSELANGYLTRCVTGYAIGGQAHFFGIWSK